MNIPNKLKLVSNLTNDWVDSPLDHPLNEEQDPHSCLLDEDHVYSNELSWHVIDFLMVDLPQHWGLPYGFGILIRFGWRWSLSTWDIRRPTTWSDFRVSSTNNRKYVASYAFELCTFSLTYLQKFPKRMYVIQMYNTTLSLTYMNRISARKPTSSSKNTIASFKHIISEI